MRLQGESINKIAEKLKREKVPIPSVYASKKGIKKAAIKAPLGEFIWSCEKVRRILTNPAYTGDVVNFRTYSKSFKVKKDLRIQWKISRYTRTYMRL